MFQYCEGENFLNILKNAQKEKASQQFYKLMEDLLQLLFFDIFLI